MAHKHGMKMPKSMRAGKMHYDMKGNYKPPAKKAGGKSKKGK